VDVERHQRRLQRRKAVMVVERVEQPQVQRPGLSVPAQSNPALARPLAIFQRHRPAGRVGHHRHPVGTQEMQFARLAGLDQLDIGVARHQQVAVERFHKARARRLRVRPRQERGQRVFGEFRRPLIEQPRHGSGGFRDHAHGAVRGRVAHIALARQRRIVGARPQRLALPVQRDEADAAFRSGARSHAGRALRPWPVPTHHRFPFSSGF